MLSDEGVSGANGIEEREALPEVLLMLQDGKADGVIVARLDRLARKLTTQEAILAQVWRMDRRVYAADAGEVLRDDPDDPMRTAMRQMVGVFAELDRKLTRKRLEDGRREKALQGGYAGGGPPLGKRAEGKALVDDEDEAATVERIRELHETGASLREICQVLTDEGHATKRGGRWQPETVKRVIARF
jgi:DNA invertase Pin-like site-specific DNA recombinase